MLSLLGVAATSADVNVRPGLQSTTLACNIVQREYKASGCCPSSLILNPDKRMLSSSMCSFFQGLQPKPTPYRATVSNFTNTDFFTNEQKVSIIRDQKYIVQFIPMVADVMIDYSASIARGNYAHMTYWEAKRGTFGRCFLRTNSGGVHGEAQYVDGWQVWELDKGCVDDLRVDDLPTGTSGYEMLKQAVELDPAVTQGVYCPIVQYQVNLPLKFATPLDDA
jgi:hypothetical protein